MQTMKYMRFWTPWKQTGEEAIRAEVRRAIDENSFGGAYMPSYIPTNAEKLEIVKDEIIRYGGSIR